MAAFRREKDGARRTYEVVTLPVAFPHAVVLVSHDQSIPHRSIILLSKAARQSRPNRCRCRGTTAGASSGSKPPLSVTDIGEHLIAQEGGRVAGLTVFLVLGEVAGAARSFLQAHHTAHPATSAPVVRVAARVVLPAPSPPHGAIEEGELGVTLEGEDVGGDAVEEPAVVGGHHDAAGDCRQRADASGTRRE